MDPANHEANDNNSNVAVNAHQRAKALKIKTDVAKNTNKRGQNSDYEGDVRPLEPGILRNKIIT